MRKIALALLFIGYLQAAKTAHPRMFLTATNLGAADGTTVGSYRWKAVQQKADWEKIRSDAESNVAFMTTTTACDTVSKGAGQGPKYVMEIAELGIILANMTVSTDETLYTPLQLIDCAKSFMIYYHANQVTASCPSGVYANCNSCAHPPVANLNAFRDAWKNYAILFDWLQGSIDPLTGTDITNAVNDLHMSAEASLTKLCYAGSPDKTAYNGAAGPAQNLYAWGTIYMIGVATYGNNPSDTSTGCNATYGETQCNDETTAALNDFTNNVIPWWSQNTLGVNGQTQCQPSVPQTQPAGGYGGGKGCGVGGRYADGNEYWPQAMHYTLIYLESSVAADSPSINLWGAMPSYFPTDQISGLIFSTSPTPTNRNGSTFKVWELDEQGDESNALGSSGLWYYDYGLSIAALYLGHHVGSTTPGNYMRWMGDNQSLNSVTGLPTYGQDPGHSTWATSWEWFLFYDDTGLTRTDYHTGITPTYFAAGEGETIDYTIPKGTSCPGVNICAASGWSIFYNREAGTNHAHPNSGDFSIMRKSAWIAMPPVGYGFNTVLSSEAHNTAVWQGPTELAGGYFRGSEVIPKGNGGNYMGGFNVANELNSPFYTYAWVDTTYTNHNQYSTNPTKTQREWVHIFPDLYVVFDRGQFASAASGAFQVNTPRKVAPSTSGGITTMTATGNNDGNGGPDQVLFITPLLPVGQTVSTANWNGGVSEIRAQSTTSAFGSAGFPSVDAGGQHYSYLGSAGSLTGEMSWDRYRGITPSTSTSFVMLNGMEGADSGATPTPSEPLSATGLACDHWQDPTKDKLVCFSSDTGGALLTLPVATYTYTPAATTSQHVMVDLPPSTAVKVAVSRGATNSYTVNNSAGAGTLMTTSANGVLAFTDNGSALTQINGSGSPSCTITSPGAGSLVAGTIGVAYNGGSGVAFTTANCAAPSFSISVGALPGGITQSGSTGLLSGTPTLPGGTFNFTVLVTDTNCAGACSSAYSISVAAPASPGGNGILGQATISGQVNIIQ